jgi:hypothetical protein
LESRQILQLGDIADAVAHDLKIIFDEYYKSFRHGIARSTFMTEFAASPPYRGPAPLRRSRDDVRESMNQM